MNFNWYCSDELVLSVTTVKPGLVMDGASPLSHVPAAVVDSPTRVTSRGGINVGRKTAWRAVSLVQRTIHEDILVRGPLRMLSCMHVC